MLKMVVKWQCLEAVAIAGQASTGQAQSRRKVFTEEDTDCGSIINQPKATRLQVGSDQVHLHPSWSNTH